MLLLCNQSCLFAEPKLTASFGFRCFATSKNSSCGNPIIGGMFGGGTPVSPCVNAAFPVLLEELLVEAVDEWEEALILMADWEEGLILRDGLEEALILRADWEEALMAGALPLVPPVPTQTTRPTDRVVRERMEERTSIWFKAERRCRF